MRRYNPKEIEPKWQEIWAKSGIYKTKEPSQLESSRLGKPKKYILEYFPYPSGATMHVGHVRNYTIGDALSRFMRMQGNNVLHPMGWDAFGLPAENFAIKNNISPEVSTEKNIKVFKQQLQQMGFSYDWEREINSSDPSYYKWTQWLFLKFYEKGLAYRAKSLQNWCPTDQTVLANEQVITKNGVNVCERDGTPVVQKEVDQWFLKITDYADRLVDDLDDLDWPEGIKAMQRNWIGRSRGSLIKFKVAAQETGNRKQETDEIEVFTTRPDTIFGATFLVLAPEHKILNMLSISEAAKKYIKQAMNKTELDRKEAEKDKTGVFTGAYTINPATKEKIPIWIADYVLMSYGTGAIMAVPAHDDRDFDFARKYKLPIKSVMVPDFGDPHPDAEYVEGCVVIPYDPKTGKYLALDKWADAVGLAGGGRDKNETFEDCAIRELKEETGISEIEQLIPLGEPVYSHYYNNLKNSYKRSLGYGYLVVVCDTKMGVTHREAHEKFEPKWMDMDEIRRGVEKLRPIKGGGVDHWLAMCDRAEAAVDAYKQKQIYQDKPYEGEGILINSGKYNELQTAEAREKMAKDFGKVQTQYRLRDWSVSRQRYWGCPIPIIYCDKDGIAPVPQEDLPVLLPEIKEFKPTGQSPLKDLPVFVNVKCPKCGGDAKRETDTFDTFIDSSWYFLRFADPKNTKEAFAKDKTDYWLPVDSYIGGAEHAVVHLLYSRFWMKFLYDQGLVNQQEPFKTLRNQGMIGGADGRKMGKRYGNVITPDELIKSGYGADALRLYELFIGPYNQGLDWNPRGIAGTYRFLDRLWVLVSEFLSNKKQADGHNSELDAQISRIVHKTVKKVSQDLEMLGFNTAIAALMECINELYKLKSDKNFALAHETWQENLRTVIQLLAPFAPHIAEELWEDLGGETSVHLTGWPTWDEELVKEEMITLAVQINGKVRAEIEVEAGTSENIAIEWAKKDPKIAEQIKGKRIKKAIYVPGRLISLVID